MMAVLLHATEHITVIQFGVSQEPGEEGTLHRNAGAETVFPNCVYCRAVAVMVLGIRRTRTPITAATQHT